MNVRAHLGIIDPRGHPGVHFASRFRMLGGGAELIATLAQADLIDDYRFLVAPIALGQGKAMFGAIPASVGD